MLIISIHKQTKTESHGLKCFGIS
ncbi:hypothetical protein M8C21_015040 [Ambrosia artemisiifolia]|uniref:Uncharacterized protein n=1 Tax=Ambrosia artemisiifolia TaxID=4212 RepID=A0AAD5C013_AMBAR|nr:hypothetical protein M8C21_015040 [Ambrosia artemisiifolia]